jgi:hypothetical protein
MQLDVKQRQGRRGAIAPMTAVLSIPVIGMMAFAIDIGYIALVQAELQNAADAAALAGAEKLQALYVQYYLPQQSQQSEIYTTATTNTGVPASPMYTAEQYANYNQAGGVNIQVPDSDVTLSYQDGQNPPQAPGFPSPFPNTITVVTRRDNIANGSLALFFGPVFNVNYVNLEATATASVYAGDVSSLVPIPNVNARILPVAEDVNTWKKYYATGVSSDGTIHPGPNGAPQLHIYPTPAMAPGNFGLLDTGAPANNVPAFRSWIDNGQTPNDISYLVSNNLLPVSPTAPQPWKCGPGLKSTLVSNFASVMGDPNLLPLFIPVNDGTNGQPYQAASGQGQNTYYNICGFVGVTVTQADGNGSNMDISVQPMAVVDPTAVINNAQLARPSQTTFFNTPQTTFISAKLTR